MCSVPRGRNPVVHFYGRVFTWKRSSPVLGLNPLSKSQQFCRVQATYQKNADTLRVTRATSTSGFFGYVPWKAVLGNEKSFLHMLARSHRVLTRTASSPSLFPVSGRRGRFSTLARTVCTTVALLRRITKPPARPLDECQVGCRSCNVCPCLISIPLQSGVQMFDGGVQTPPPRSCCRFP